MPTFEAIVWRTLQQQPADSVELVCRLAQYDAQTVRKALARLARKALITPLDPGTRHARGWRHRWCVAAGVAEPGDGRQARAGRR